MNVMLLLICIFINIYFLLSSYIIYIKIMNASVALSIVLYKSDYYYLRYRLANREGIVYCDAWRHAVTLCVCPSPH